MSYLTVVCSHCREVMGYKDGGGQTGVSHSICEKCWYEHYPQLGKYPGESSDDEALQTVSPELESPYG